MQVFVNEPFLAKRGKWAKWGTYVGLGSLVVGLLSSAQQPLLAYGFMLIGLLGASFGSYMANRYVRTPRPDQVLEHVLEGLDKRYCLYNYYFPAAHVIASHFGLTVVVSRSQKGIVSWDGKHWRHQAGWQKVMQFFGEPGLGRPDQDVEEEVRIIKDWIDKIFPEDSIPVNGVIFFTSPEVDLQQSADMPVKAVTREEIFAFMKQGLKENPVLTTAKQKDLRRVMDEVVASKS